MALHFLADATLFTLSLIVAAFLRFGDEAQGSLWLHWPAGAIGSLALSVVVYICGLYSTHSSGRGVFERAVLLFGCTCLATLVVIAVSYAGLARPLGRGVMFLGGAMAFVLVLFHHIWLLHTLRAARERVAYIVTSTFDEVETRLFEDFKSHSFELVGVVTACGYTPTGPAPVLGSVEKIAEIVSRYKVDRVLCTHKNLNNFGLTRHFCQLRYSGVTVMPLIILCEEVQQFVPLELVTHEWLLNASGEPQMLYIKKVKRLFDIIAAAVGLIFGAPLILLAAIGTKLTSPGPIFYRQERSGRFGRTFKMTKLRSMHVDAEKNGIQWSSKDDPRVTLIGHFLRKYRIDEIPQLWHVLTGDMSFVGPRPERPEIIQRLALEIPFYEERLMIQPGITGWAQVNYPYGASTLDARRKLEYDLYYMKHMSWFLDIFILLDTVRIVLLGGAAHVAKPESHFETMREWERLKPVDAATTNTPTPRFETTHLGAA